MLGFDVSERTISRWMKRASTNPDPAKRWLTFLRNHKEAIAAMDFFTVPTVTFRVLYCRHDRRSILHFNICQTISPCPPETQLTSVSQSADDAVSARKEAILCRRVFHLRMQSDWIRSMRRLTIKWQGC
jgi:hypothetical protein